MGHTPQLALSPLDDRYAHQTKPLAKIFNEAALIQHRLLIEIKYLQALSKHKIIRSFSKKEKDILVQLLKPKSSTPEQIKAIEEKTHHDVKAVEYFIRQEFEQTTLKDLIPFIHFGLTSEDVNNLAYRLMIKQGLNEIIKPELKTLLLNLADLSQKHAALPMLARTHGQAAIPTTLGKELAVFASRLLPLYIKLKNTQLQGKLNGAVGGYQALNLAFSDVNWIEFSQKFVEKLGFEHLSITTQINPQDDLVQLFQLLEHFNSILIGLNQDIWRYISDGWLAQKGKKKHVGSSTMPQKINPIEFENSEGNLKLANGLLQIFICQFPISRLQRDLSDSTIRRNIGTAFGHCLLAYSKLNKGLSQIEPNKTKIKQDLEANWNILAEAAQTIARQQGDQQAYEKLAKLSKNTTLDKSSWQQSVSKINPKLEKLTPSDYTGLSAKLAKQTGQQIYQVVKKEAI